MNIISGFNLFVRQALLYPLTSPFLPAVADVKKDVSYANGSLLGTYEVAPSVLTWTDSTFSGMDWDTAVLYAQYLDADGTTVDETPQNYWTLPTESQLLSAISDQFILLLPSQTGFSVYTFYLSGSEVDSVKFYNAYWNTSDLVATKVYKSDTSNSFRCVH